MSVRLIALLVLVLSVMPAIGQQAAPVVELAAGVHRIEAEVAATLESRMIGLMRRTAMPQQRGMLFVFTERAQHCMWMRNTDLPLSVAFLDDQGRIVNIEDMQPHTEDNHCARKPVRYALEMNLGWFKSRRIAPGATISGLQAVPSGR
jgi:uncharacterized membrane protein (UPF0127 family)